LVYFDTNDPKYSIWSHAVQILKNDSDYYFGSEKRKLHGKPEYFASFQR